jgi:hypothetical protein
MLLALPLVHARAQARPSEPPATLADTASLYAWWMSVHATPADVAGSAALVTEMPSKVRFTPRAVQEMPLERVLRRKRPGRVDVERSVPVAFEIRDGESFVTWLPKLEPSAAGESERCQPRSIWLAVLSLDEWTRLEFDLNCREGANLADVEFGEYAIDGDDWPLIEITWPGPECVQARLFRLDPKWRMYDLVRSACRK